MGWNMKNNKIALFLDVEGTLYDNQLQGMRPKTIELFTSYLKNAQRVVINGPMGIFEDTSFSKGTDAIYKGWMILLTWISWNRLRISFGTMKARNMLPIWIP